MAELTSIGGHRLLRLLGEGGMGRVYLAEDETLGRRTAIKVVSERFAADADARARFLREARAMATVEHPHVVRVYSFGESAGSAYLVMELIEGEMLSARLGREGPLPPSEALRIVQQVVEALQAAWEKKLVHRDIKPSNILLDSKGQVHVADFGLAKPIQMATEEGDASLTATGSILGTPHYLSPEQARGKVVDFRSDIYSLGVVLYELLTGERPFEGATPIEVVAHHLQDPVPPLGSLRPDLPQSISSSVEWMTAKDPSQRPESLAALRERIDAILTRGSSLAGAATTPQPASKHGGGRRRWLMATLTTLAVAAIGWQAWRSLSREAPLPGASDRLRVAVAPFYGPDEDSTKEGRVMAALVEKAISQRLPRDNTTVLGVEETKQSVRDHDAARALGERLGADLVVWGEALVLRGETEIQPYFTLVPRRVADPAQQVQRLGRDPFEPLREQTARSVVVGAQAPNQIELRKTGAAGISDLVLVLAGVHALHLEGKPEKALALFEQAPPSSETLRYQAEALLALRRIEPARKALEEATLLDPDDAEAWASLGDLHMDAAHRAEAVGAYRRAAEAGGEYRTRQAILFEGKLYEKEVYPSFLGGAEGEPTESGYVLALDPESGTVLERHRCPGWPLSLSVRTDGLHITGGDGSRKDPAEFTVVLSEGRALGPVPLATGLLARRLAINAGRVLAVNFVPGRDEKTFEPRGTREHAPRSFPELEAALCAARERDPTQPWHLFYLGQAQWWQGRRDEAAATWAELFAGEFSATPYYEYTWMASDFELLGQPDWADRAFQEALARRKALPQPIGEVTLLDRMITSRFVPLAAGRLRETSPSEADLDRGHLWLARARELGPVPEGDDFAAAAWSAYFRRQGETAEADAEDVFRARMQRAPLNFPQVAAQWDYAFQISLVATVTLWLVLFGFVQRRRRSLPLRRGERRTLAVGLLVVAASQLALGLAAGRFEAFGQVFIGWGDSLSGPATIRDLEQRLVDRPSNPVRFLAAVAHHLAGHADRARELYESLPDDPRAQKNLEALHAGAPTPPELRDEDFAAAYLTLPWRKRLRSLWRAQLLLSEMAAAKGWLVVLVAASVFAAGLGLVVGTLLLVRAGPRVRATPTHTGSSRNGRLANWIPGLSDLSAGRPLRGYAALMCFCFVSLAVAVHAVAAWSTGTPGAGFVSADNVSSVLRAYPLPPLSFWPLFWTYKDAPWFWTAVGVALATSLALHLTRSRPGPDQATTAVADATRTRLG